MNYGMIATGNHYYYRFATQSTTLLCGKIGLDGRFFHNLHHVICGGLRPPTGGKNPAPTILKCK